MEREETGYQFDTVTVWPRRFAVLLAGKPVELEPKSFKVLLYFIENHGRAVSKDELMSAVWQGTAVTDNALTRVIAQLRRELGDDARNPRYIETVPTIGYRFVADVRPLAPQPAATEPEPAAPVQPPAAPAFPAAASRNRVRWIWAIAGLQAIVILTLALGRFRGDDRPFRPESVRQMTASSGLDQHPTFSPDGSSIAFSSDRTGRFEIYVRSLASGAREMQITSDGRQNLEPAWSPDGKFIAYHSQVRDGIFIVPALGGVARRLTDFGSQPAWSPNGAEIVFTSATAPSLVPIDLAPPTESTLWIAPAAGGQPRRLTVPEQPAGKHNFPSWSPDGRSIVFICHAGGSSSMWTISVSDGAVNKIRRDDSGMFYPTYSADGQSIYFVATTASRNGYSLWHLPLNGAEAKEIMPVGLSFPRDLAVDAGGHRLAYSLQSTSSNLYALNPSDGSTRALVDDRSFRNTLPIFSPDASRIAFLVQRFGVPGNIWIMDAKGGSPTRLSQNDSAEWVAGWIDGGRRLAYGALSERRHTLLAVNLADGSTSMLADLHALRPFMRLSPDGRELLYHEAAGGKTNVWKMDIESGKNTQLTFGAESMSYAVWSPDGQSIAFETWQGPNTFLMVMDRSGQRQRQLTREAGHSWPYSWSPDGDRIAFAGMRDGAWNIWWVSVSSGMEQKLTDYTSFRSFVRYPAWSPSGDSIVYELAETKGNIYVADLP